MRDNYRCNACGHTYYRDSQQYWIKSYCEHHRRWARLYRISGAMDIVGVKTLAILDAIDRGEQKRRADYAGQCHLREEHYHTFYCVTCGTKNRVDGEVSKGELLPACYHCEHVNVGGEIIKA